MALRPVLVVVVIADAVLRTMVVRRLAMQGVELLSASQWNGRLLAAPGIRPHSLLVVDESAAGHAEAIAHQCREGRWRRVVMLTTRASGGDDRDPRSLAERCVPADLLPRLFANGTCAAAA